MRQRTRGIKTESTVNVIDLVKQYHSAEIVSALCAATGVVQYKVKVGATSAYVIRESDAKRLDKEFTKIVKESLLKQSPLFNQQK